MLATTLCRDSDPADSSVNGHFPSFRAVYSIHTVCEGARPDEVQDILGHANIDVTQNVPHNLRPCAFAQHTAGMHGAEAPKMPFNARIGRV